MISTIRLTVLAAVACVAGSALARPDGAVGQYGDADVLGVGVYAEDPTVGATRVGLPAGVLTLSTLSTEHIFPFTPFGDFDGTDEIFVGSNQVAAHDGYSQALERAIGPQTLFMDYSDLLEPDEVLTGLTLGIAADDFQFPQFGQSFFCLVNGVQYQPLNAALNALDLTGPQVRYFSIGLPLSYLRPDGVEELTLVIDQMGDGGDGWAVDFVTIGVTTVSVPGPAGVGVLAFAACAAARRRR